ncbi:carbohydrate ABC transporter permease [Clostridium sp. Marseille-P299]|uniref:carbohydrate ABC transporter permease n=1 Tax=Clostridium sp. Marseille-P299 TaxID=1805477 RepID=UPI000831C9A9|nr:carbohydrate ABC transporter permease [Clostridium sp. Marseille-P299]
MKTSHQKGNTIKMSRSNRNLNVICYGVIGIFAIICLFPFALMITSSFMTEKEIVAEGYKLFPKEISFSAYKYLLDNPTKLIDAYKVTITTTVVGTVLGLLIMSMAGYVLNRKDFRYRNFFSFFIYFTTLFSGGLVPSYILNVRYLHLKDSLWAMILPGLISAWSIFLMRNFMKAIPDELYESAMMDGAGAFSIYRKIFMPLAIPSLATVGLFLALGYWNQWYNASLYIDTPSKYPLQYYLQKMINQANIEALTSQGHVIDIQSLPTQSVKMATAVLTIGPIILLYPFVQKYFVTGLTMGSVKG